MRLLLFLIFLPLFGWVQDDYCSLQFSYQCDSSVSINQLKFYITDLTLFSENGSEFHPKEGECILYDIDSNFDTIYVFNVDKKFKVDSISFKLGTDSTLNVSGRLDGNLDPVLGMYWAWNTGYINFKLEGSKKLQDKSASFEYHLGGYRAPFETVRNLGYKVNGNDIELILDLNAIITEGLLISNSVMIPGRNAQFLMSKIDFRLKSDE